MSQERGEGDAAEDERSNRITEDHHAFAIPAIHQRASIETQQDEWERIGGADESCLDSGVGQRQDEEREGNVRHAPTELRHTLTGQEDDVVAIPRQRCLGTYHAPLSYLAPCA